MRWRRDDRLQPDERADVPAEEWLLEFRPIRPDALTAADKDANQQPRSSPDETSGNGRWRAGPERLSEQDPQDARRRGRPREQDGLLPPPGRPPRREMPGPAGFGQEGSGTRNGHPQPPPAGYRRRPDADPRDYRAAQRPDGYRQGQERREAITDGPRPDYDGRAGQAAGPGGQRQPREGAPDRYPARDGYRSERPGDRQSPRPRPADSWPDRNGARGWDDPGGPVGGGREQPNGSRTERRGDPRASHRDQRGDYPIGRDQRGGRNADSRFPPGGGFRPGEGRPAGDGFMAGGEVPAGHRQGAGTRPARPESGSPQRGRHGLAAPHDARSPRPSWPARKPPGPDALDAPQPRSADTATPYAPGQVSTDNPDETATFPLPVILPGKAPPPELSALPGAKLPGPPLPPEPSARPAAKLPSATMLPRPGPVEAPRGPFEPARPASPSTSAESARPSESAEPGRRTSNSNGPMRPASITGSVEPPAFEPRQLPAGASAKLDQIKDLYLTAEAIGEDALDKHFEQVSERQRELIREFFDKSGGP